MSGSSNDSDPSAQRQRSGWNAKLMDALSHGTLAQLSQVARESSPLIESTYQPSTPRMDGYTPKPRFDYKMRQVGEDDE